MPQRTTVREPAIPGFHPPKQARSRDALERIVRATRKLILERSDAEVSLGDIAVEARVSSSTLYARFESKEALLEYVHAEHCAEARREVEECVQKLEQRQLPLAQLAEEGFRFAIGLTRRNRPMSRALERLFAQSPAMAARQAEVERANLEHFERLLERGWPELVVGEKREQVAESLRVFTVLLREGVDTPDVHHLAAGGGDSHLAERLTQMALRTLGLEDTRPSAVPAGDD